MEHSLAYSCLKFKLSSTFKFQTALHCGVVGRVTGLGEGGWGCGVVGRVTGLGEGGRGVV